MRKACPAEVAGCPAGQDDLDAWLVGTGIGWRPEARASRPPRPSKQPRGAAAVRPHLGARAQSGGTRRCPNRGLTASWIDQGPAEPDLGTAATVDRPLRTPAEADLQDPDRGEDDQEVRPAGDALHPRPVRPRDCHHARQDEAEQEHALEPGRDPTSDPGPDPELLTLTTAKRGPQNPANPAGTLT